MKSELQPMAIAALGRDPGSPSIEFDGRWVTCAEVKALSDAIHRLLDASGVREDGPIALLTRNRPGGLVALLSLLARGCNIEMIYTFQSAAGVARDLDRLAPAAMIAETGDYSDEVEAALGRSGMAALALDGMEVRAVPGFEKVAADPARDGPAERQIGVYTSGTTGPPKQFYYTHEMIAQHIVKRRYDYASGGAAPAEMIPMLLYFPFGNISGIYGVMPTILTGQRAILIDRFSIEAWRQYVVRYRPPMGGIPPSYFQVLLDADIPAADLASIKAMVAGAAPVDPQVQAAFEAKYGIPILCSYGATEFGGPVTAMSLEDHSRCGKAKLGSVGKAINDARLRVVDPDTGLELPPSEEGLLEVISPAIGPEWIRTTDRGMIDEDGFIFHRGRADGAIVRGGFKIIPETIEAALRRHPMVSEAVVVGIPDRRLGQAPAAAIRLVPRAEGVDEAVLEAHLRQLVMTTHIPVRWMFREELPRTISAKLDRNAVRKLFVEDQA